MEESLLSEIMAIGEDIISSDRFAKAHEVIHHSKDGNIARHSVETACYALMLTRWLADHGIEVNKVDAVRASLLHDIGMTEDFVFLSPSRSKARSHPREGARIAAKEFGANKTQVDAILHHMWPVCCYTPPKSIEGWVVSLADKCCSVIEAGRNREGMVDMAGHWLLEFFGEKK